MAIVGGPESNYVSPRALLIVLASHPVLLGVARQSEWILLLGANETLVIVRGRIHQVPQYLFGCPLARSAGTFRIGLCKRRQLEFGSLDLDLEPRTDLCKPLLCQGEVEVRHRSSYPLGDDLRVHKASEDDT